MGVRHCVVDVVPGCSRGRLFVRWGWSVRQEIRVLRVALVQMRTMALRRYNTWRTVGMIIAPTSVVDPRCFVEGRLLVRGT